MICLSACQTAATSKVDPTPLPYTPVEIEPLEIARGDPVAGEAVYAQYCESCHSTEEAVELAGPSFFEAGSRLTFKFIKTSLENPHDYNSHPDSTEFMPEGIADQLDKEEFYSVIAYIRAQK
jgi:mono/diheme cytochrome c family protein